MYKTKYKKIFEMKYGDKFKFDIGFGCYTTCVFIAKSKLCNQYIIEQEIPGPGVIKPLTYFILYMRMQNMKW